MSKSQNTNASQTNWASEQDCKVQSETFNNNSQVAATQEQYEKLMNLYDH